MIEQRAPGAARIVDRGYQHYQGARLGPGHAVQAMILGNIRRMLGIRRHFRAKILPWILLIACYIPMIVVLALYANKAGDFARAVPNSELFPNIYSGLFLIFVLFSATAAPDLLCNDRREGVLSLYLASPITRLHYIGAKVASLTVLMAALTLLPFVLLFVGIALLSDGAASYVRDHLTDLGHIVVGGGLLALYYSLLALAVACFTDRRAYAAGAYIGLLLVTGVAGNVLSQQLHFDGHERFAVLDLINLPVRAVRWMLDGVIRPDLATGTPELSGWAYLGVSLGVSAGCLALLLWQYLWVHDS